MPAAVAFPLLMTCKDGGDGREMEEMEKEIKKKDGTKREGQLYILLKISSLKQLLPLPWVITHHFHFRND